MALSQQHQREIIDAIRDMMDNIDLADFSDKLDALLADRVAAGDSGYLLPMSGPELQRHLWIVKTLRTFVTRCYLIGQQMEATDDDDLIRQAWSGMSLN